MAWPVLLMVRELDLGGSERQMVEVAKALDRSRFDPRVGCLRREGMRVAEVEAAGIPIVHFPVPSFASPGMLSGTWRLARYMHANRIRLIHTFDYPSAMFAVGAARLLSDAAVVSSQRSHRDLIPRRYLRWVRLSDRWAEAIVVNCDFVRRHLESDERVPAEKIRLCYNGVDVDVFHPGSSPRPPGVASGALIIGVVCALRPEKGLPTLLRAFASVCRSERRLQLVVVGDGSEREALQAEANALGISGQCVISPATSQVGDWLRAIDIFVLPSLSEALSNSLMEAMACGCCVIASNVGGNPELVEHGKTGLLFEAGDVPGLSAALQTLVEDEPMRKRLSAAGTQLMRDRFSIGASVTRLGEIYTDLIERLRSA